MIARSYCDETLPNSRRQTVDSIWVPVLEVSASIESADILTTFCSRDTQYGTSSAATLLVENVHTSSLLEIQDNNSLSGRAFKNSSEVERQKYVAL